MIYKGHEDDGTTLNIEERATYHNFYKIIMMWIYAYILFWMAPDDIEFYKIKFNIYLNSTNHPVWHRFFF